MAYPELAHDEVDALLHLLLVRVAHLLHVRLRHAMCAEEDLHLSRVHVEFEQLGLWGGKMNRVVKYGSLAGLLCMSMGIT